MFYSYLLYFTLISTHPSHLSFRHPVVSDFFDSKFGNSLRPLLGGKSFIAWQAWDIRLMHRGATVNEDVITEGLFNRSDDPDADVSVGIRVLFFLCFVFVPVSISGSV